ncbi:hypothetical protein BLNAU_21018 [Blattamonas nauphoetae]|uniref:PPPDE domain-containing protein n=1 Tax=Blattamonas nauphoetae TaxID=2049346 RepID=A0ABQ9WX48_9EUKA|nr:hypothetical protein BLNAU_21018 [Blattamonas nauphoetae]
MPERSKEIPQLTDKFLNAPSFYISINTRPVNSGSSTNGVNKFNKPTHAMVHIQPSDGKDIGIKANGLTVDFNPEGIGFFHRSLMSCNEEAGTMIAAKESRPGLDFAAIQKWLEEHKEEFKRGAYKLLTNNCQNFANKFYHFLTKKSENEPDDPLATKHTRGVKDAMVKAGKIVLCVIVVAVSIAFGLFGLFRGFGRDRRKK